MKITEKLPYLLMALLITCCTASKKVGNDAIFDTTWELEYLSGPRIAFEGLYPDKKPKISFDKATQRVSGTNSCNGYSTNFELNENHISFGEPGPTTMMFCGEGENFFLNTMKKVNAYNIDADGKLNLLINDVPMMRFKKVSE